jgi:hypothetical protein
MSERTLHGLDFGLDHTGRMRGIDEVEQGLACNCECPECGSPLIARKGAVRVHHFAHQGESCTTGAETALHRMAKEIVRTGIPTIELDLSTAYRRKRLGWTIEQLTDRLVRDPAIRRWLHLPEPAAEKEWRTTPPETQTQTKPAAPLTSTRTSCIYAPYLKGLRLRTLLETKSSVLRVTTVRS